jgi:hypothetical protein
MKSVCDKYGALLILDEVVYIPLLVNLLQFKKKKFRQIMSGMGRECLMIKGSRL